MTLTRTINPTELWIEDLCNISFNIRPHTILGLSSEMCIKHILGCLFGSASAGEPNCNLEMWGSHSVGAAGLQPEAEVCSCQDTFLGLWALILHDPNPVDKHSEKGKEKKVTICVKFSPHEGLIGEEGKKE